MILSKLKLSNFKNYAELEVEFCEKINCLVGNNGVGKTNLLDAIYYLSFCKSYFNSQDSQNIKYGEDFFAIHGKYISAPDARTDAVTCIQKRSQGKQVLFNKKNYERFSDHIGKIPLVIISPYDQDLINEGSNVRRKFLDGVISQVDKVYLDQLLNYQKALEQRNKLLKFFNTNRCFDNDAIELWDEQLQRFGEPIFEKRIVFLEKFSTIFNEYFNLISSAKELVSIEYISTLNQDFRRSLLETRKKDLTFEYTTTGIHKDDLLFKINEHPAKRSASQGQQKSFVLALKLAQFEYISACINIRPILLLDDIFDKLDLLRVKHLLQLVGSNRFSQVFLTDTQQNRVEEMFRENNTEHKIFFVNDNQLEEQ